MESKTSPPTVDAGGRLPCPACGSASELSFKVRDRNRRISDISFKYYQCPNCRFIFIDEPPKDLGRYYTGDYYSLPDSAAEFERDAAPEQYKIDIVQRFAPGGRLVEVGPARGNFCYLAKKAGFEVTAIERDSRCCEFIQRCLGITAINATDELAALEQVEPADVIALWHVVEHLQDPWRFLEMAGKKLRPNGILLIATPNPAAFQFGILGRFWTHIDAPRHLCIIPPQLLEQKLTAFGLTRVLQTTTDPGSLGWNAFGWIFSFSNFFSNNVLRRIARLCGRVVTAVARPLEQQEGRGAAYTAVFRRPGP